MLCILLGLPILPLLYFSAQPNPPATQNLTLRNHPRQRRLRRYTRFRKVFPANSWARVACVHSALGSYKQEFMMRSLMEGSLANYDWLDLTSGSACKSRLHKVCRTVPLIVGGRKYLYNNKQ